MNYYNVGDWVKILSLSEVYKRMDEIEEMVEDEDDFTIHGILFNYPMRNFCGREAIITNISGNQYSLKFKNAVQSSRWHFSSNMFQFVPSPLPKKNRDFNKELL